MLETIARIERYTAGMTFEAFCSDQKTIQDDLGPLKQHLQALLDDPDRAG